MPAYTILSKTSKTASSDLIVEEFFFFLKLKSTPEGQYFQTIEDIKEGQVAMLSKWCINSEEEYFEGSLGCRYVQKITKTSSGTF